MTGASGTGTSTLGAALSARLSCAHLESDDFLWEPTWPKFRTLRPPEERIRLLLPALDDAGDWVLSGSLCGWGDPAVPRFSLVVFLTLPPDLRLARLHAREEERYRRGTGRTPEEHVAVRDGFLEWAARYDEGGMDVRSRALHEAWLAELPCPVLRLEGDLTTDERTARVLAALPR